MARGGKRENAGRKSGSINKVSAQKRAEIEASGLTPLDYMIGVMRDTTASLDRRDDMAKAAAPYVHHKLAAIEHTGKDGAPLQIIISSSDAEL